MVYTDRTGSLITNTAERHVQLRQKPHLTVQERPGPSKLDRSYRVVGCTGSSPFGRNGRYLRRREPCPTPFEQERRGTAPRYVRLPLLNRLSGIHQSRSRCGRTLSMNSMINTDRMNSVVGHIYHCYGQLCRETRAGAVVYRPFTDCVRWVDQGVEQLGLWLIMYKVVKSMKRGHF